MSWPGDYVWFDAIRVEQSCHVMEAAFLRPWILVP